MRAFDMLFNKRPLTYLRLKVIVQYKRRNQQQIAHYSD